MKIYEICFSPTGGTKKVAEFLTHTLQLEPIHVDLTDPQTDFRHIAINQEDVALIAVPSYGGRVPAPAVERITQMQGNGARAILVCVYGNRAYEDTLIELQDTALQAGFSVMAAVATVAEHSIARKYAAGRPDQEDYRQLKEFACIIGEKLKKEDVSAPGIPGNKPYRKFGKVGIVPKTTKACTRCGLCATQCPVGAIHKENPTLTDKKACISCMRCISVCPHKAKRVNSLLLMIVNQMLKKKCSGRKEAELYI